MSPPHDAPILLLLQAPTQIATYIPGYIYTAPMCSIYGTIPFKRTVPSDISDLLSEIIWKVGDANLGLFKQRGVEELQLGAQSLEVADGVGRGAIDDMHERACSLAVPQKLVPEAHAGMRALQQPFGNAQHTSEVVKLLSNQSYPNQDTYDQRTVCTD